MADGVQSGRGPSGDDPVNANRGGHVVPDFSVTSEWADLSSIPRADVSWAHSGLAVSSDGELFGFHAGRLVAFDKSGGVLRVINAGLIEGHGITLVQEEGEEFLWITDPGFVFALSNDAGDEEWAALFGRGIQRENSPPRVIKMTLDGEIRSELPLPPMDSNSPAGMMGQYCPCGTAVDEERFGGTGDIWVADGYGASLVHRFDSRGNHLLALTGEEGGGRFVCPHAVFIDRRLGKSPELYIADRENKRVQVYDLEGQYVRMVGEDFLNSPSGFVQWGDLLVVAELYSRLAVLDARDSLLGYIGADPSSLDARDWPDKPGWPNALSDEGRAKVPDLPQPGRFNSPHSVATDADGNLYVCEWLLGGRYTKLAIHRSRPDI